LSDSNQEYDLIIIGGGIAASFICLSIFKVMPNFKILIIEKSEEFSQKIGESVVDVTALLVESLEIEHLLKEHALKSGIRFLFNESNSVEQANVAEFASPTLNGRIKGYHLNRKLFDEQLLEEVVRKGATLLRPATIKNYTNIDFKNEFEIETTDRIVSCFSKWVVDASGRARYISKKLNWSDKLISLQTGAISAHFKNITPPEKWDSPKNDYWDKNAINIRSYSTTHFMRKNCWWWLIKLDDTTTSVGLVFDKNKISFENYEDFFFETIANDNQLQKILLNAERGKINYLENVPYVSEKLYAKGIALLGDSGAFIDPLISPGLELMGQQCQWLAKLLTNEKKTGIHRTNDWSKYEDRFQKAYDSRILIYSRAYNFLHSFDLFSAWLKQGNYIYFGWIVFPSIIFKSRLKYPLRFNLIERGAVKYFANRFEKINAKRENLNVISNTKPFKITYSKVRVPKGIGFIFIPTKLFVLAILAYLNVELKALKYLFKSKT